jgi:SAM-dependent methyltransferase
VSFCCQVLAHLPYESFDGSLAELRRVLKPSGKLVLSLPNGGFYLGLDVRLPKLRFLRVLPVPLLRARQHPSDRKHLWEINRAGFPVPRVRRAIAAHFEIEREFRPAENPYHHFFAGRPRPWSGR